MLLYIRKTREGSIVCVCVCGDEEATVSDGDIYCGICIIIIIDLPYYFLCVGIVYYYICISWSVCNL